MMAVCGLLLSCAESDDDQINNNVQMPDNDKMNNIEIKPKWEAFSLEELAQQRLDSGGVFLEFLDRISMQAGFLELSPGQSDDRPSVTGDQLYYFSTGTGILNIGSEKVSIEPGQIIFVKSGRTSLVASIDTDVQAVIITMKTPSDPGSPAWRKYGRLQIESPRKSNQNVWNPFLQRSNLLVGLYILPQSIGGDGRLVHSWEELNIVTGGKSKFTMDSKEVDVQKGSIIFVQNGNGHFFRSLLDDTDILILWKQP